MKKLIPPFTTFVVLIVVWQLAVMALHVEPFLLPSPIAVLQAAIENAHVLLPAAGLTAAGALCGFTASFLGGVLIAFIFSQSEWIRRGFFPYAIFLQTVPVVAIAPLIILWFDTGFQSVVIVSFIISLFPIITNATAGLTQIDPALMDLFSLYKAKRLQVLFKLRLPHAVPSLVTGARISSGLSVIGAIVGEFFAGYGNDQFGLGYLIVLTSGQLKTAYLFAAILCATLLGFAIFSLVGWLSERALRRWHFK